MGLLSSERRHNFPHSIVQEMEGPRDEVNFPKPYNLYLCPRELGIQLFLQGCSLPSTAARCPYKRLYDVFVTRNVSEALYLLPGVGLRDLGQVASPRDIV